MMIRLLKCLVILLQNPQPLSLSKYVKNPTNQLGPTESYLSGLTEFIWRLPQLNPNKLDPLIWILVSPRRPCQLSVICCNYFGLTEFCNRCHQDGLPTFCCLIASHRSYGDDAIGAIETRLSLPLHIGRSEMFPFGPTETSNIHIFYTGRCHRES